MHQLGDLTSQQWAWVLSAFSYPYLILDPVSTILMKRFTPRKWMSRILLSWVSSVRVRDTKNNLLMPCVRRESFRRAKLPRSRMLDCWRAGCCSVLQRRKHTEQ